MSAPNGTSQTEQTAILQSQPEGMKPCLEPAQSLLGEVLKGALQRRLLAVWQVRRFHYARAGTTAGARRGHATFGIQRVNLEGQRRVLQMKLSRGGHDLDLTDDVHDGVATQYLARDCKQTRTEQTTFIISTCRPPLATREKARIETAIIKRSRNSSQSRVISDSCALFADDFVLWSRTPTFGL